MVLANQMQPHLCFNCSRYVFGNIHLAKSNTNIFNAMDEGLRNQKDVVLKIFYLKPDN